jgi:hypothetical protein
LSLHVAEIYLAEESAEQALADVAAGTEGAWLLALVPLMKNGGEAGTIKGWTTLAGGLPDERLRGDLGILALVLAELTPAWQDWQDALKGWNMRESQTALAFVNEGKALGLKEGRLLALRSTLRKLLEKRFGLLPSEWLQRIESLQDTEKLEAALLEVLSIKNLEELEL